MHRPARHRPLVFHQQQRNFRPHMEGVVYAIGDIHGRLDLFDQLIGRIRADAERLGADRPTIVLLGDLIDRGPASAGCVERALALSDEPWCQVELLLGNHEESMLGFLQDSSTGEPWLRHGGDATIASYGIDPRQASRAGWPGLRDALASAVPQSHVDFLSRAELWLSISDYVFVHAGVRPGTPLEEQTAQDLLWIRQPFLNAETAPCPGKIVVHGHTPTPEPRITRWTIGVDTGAYASGILTAVRLRGYERTVLQTL